MQVKVRDRFRPFFPLALLRVRREIARARAEISSERAPFSFFSKDSEKNESVRFAHFQFASIIKRNHLSPKEGSRERERVRVRFPPHKRESRASDLRSKKRNSEKKRNSRLLESALKERKAFISVLRFFPRHQRKKRSSQKQKKKKREISREKTPKGGKALAF